MVCFRRSKSKVRKWNLLIGYNKLRRWRIGAWAWNQWRFLPISPPFLQILLALFPSSSKLPFFPSPFTIPALPNPFPSQNTIPSMALRGLDPCRFNPFLLLPPPPPLLLLLVLGSRRVSKLQLHRTQLLFTPRHGVREFKSHPSHLYICNAFCFLDFLYVLSMIWVFFSLLEIFRSLILFFFFFFKVFFWG